MTKLVDAKSAERAEHPEKQKEHKGNSKGAPAKLRAQGVRKEEKCAESNGLKENLNIGLEQGADKQAKQDAKLKGAPQELPVLD